jgi:6-phosphogluconolactonase
MKIETLPNADAVAKAAAEFIAAAARKAISERGKFTMAVSGGKTPWAMLRDLASENLPWELIHIFQVDERIALEGDPDRNLTHLLASLATAPIPAENIHPMPVNGVDPTEGAHAYAKTLAAFCGTPATLDLAHLGLGPDGHTASLVPNDPVLGVQNRDVSLTGEYQKRLRMTLTYPMLNRSRQILWLATGAEKAPMIARLKAADPGIPAGLIEQSHALLLADEAAVAGLRF